MTDRWDDYLDPDERLLWTGAPATGLRITPRGIATSLGSLFLLGFALFWTAGAGIGLWSGEWREADGFMRVFMIAFPLFGLPFIAPASGPGRAMP
jgi:ABC-type Na+ efflux pump permease subunit